MDQFERRLLETSPLKPLCWFRYIDDIFFIWTHGVDELSNFINVANNLSPSIQLTFEHSSKSVSFLDVLVRLSDSQITTEVFHKPTDTQQYLHFDSCHPTSHKLPIAYSQALRIHKICSDKGDAVRHCEELKDSLVRRGYPRGAVVRNIRRALATDRKALIYPMHQEAKEPLSLVLPYHPDVAHIPNILRRHEHLLRGHDIHTRVYWKVPKKLKNVLVSSHLHTTVDRPLRRAEGGMQRCGRSGCLTCPTVSHNDTATSSTTGLIYRTPHATCASTKVVYLIKFTNCGKQYIGQTTQQFSKRMNLHRSAVKLKKVQQPFANHFHEHKHKWVDVETTILEIVEDNEKLDRSEFFWISQMMTDHPFSLNIQNVLYRNVFSMSDLH
jgi:hypothetical protein